jgi:hypothetical protein
MSQTISIRLNKELSVWLAGEARRAGVSQGRIVRDQLEKARNSAGSQAFMRHAGTVKGPKNLSERKGYASK